MKMLAVITCALVFTGTAAIAGTLTYTFDFAIGGTIYYVTSSPTAPGTDLSSLVCNCPGALFPPVAERELSGAWDFKYMWSPTATEDFLAQTDLTFPNVPGFYPGLPATYSVQEMFVVTNYPTTVDISIQETPEPSTAVLFAGGLVLLGGIARLKRAPVSFPQHFQRAVEFVPRVFRCHQSSFLDIPPIDEC